jgi:hypothetical protein
MRIFEKPSENFVCPLCGTNDERPVTLVSIDGTQEGKIAEARQYHVDCIALTEVKLDKQVILISQTFTKRNANG